MNRTVWLIDLMREELVKASKRGGTCPATAYKVLGALMILNMLRDVERSSLDDDSAAAFVEMLVKKNF